MELTQLRYFYAVSKNLHVTKTAEQLHIAQPALTQAIQRLEKELGHSLFFHQGRRIFLTEYGKYLQDRLAPILETLDRLPRDMETLASIKRETLHINMNAASTVVTECIINYRKANHDVNFQVFQNDSEMPYDIDISTEWKHKRETISSDVFSERIYLAVPTVGKYAGRYSVALSEVADDEFISLAGSKSLRSICDRFCREAGFTPNVIFESDNQNAVKNLIAANTGIGFWPEFTWGKLDRPEVRLIPISYPECKREIIITYNENKEDMREVKKFYQYLTDYFRSLCSS